MIDSFHSFPVTEIQLGHVLPSGVVIGKWNDTDEMMGSVTILMTAAGVGHALPVDGMVENVLGRVSDEIAAEISREFAENYVEMFGDPTEDL